MDKFEGKVAIVTGGASGIGKATSLGFSKEGAKVVISDVNVDAGEEVVKIIKKAGGEASFTETDVTKADDVRILVESTVDDYGKLDYAFNNAGIGGELASIIDYTEENWDLLSSINLKGVWLCMKYELPHMIKQGHGVIVNSSSIAGISALGSNVPAYSANKAGIVNLTRIAAKSYRAKGVRVNAVCPGYIRTPMLDVLGKSPSGRAQLLDLEKAGFLGEPKDIAEAVMWLCSDSARFVNGHVLVVDGGITL